VVYSVYSLQQQQQLAAWRRYVEARASPETCWSFGAFTPPRIGTVALLRRAILPSPITRSWKVSGGGGDLGRLPSVKLFPFEEVGPVPKRDSSRAFTSAAAPSTVIAWLVAWLTAAERSK